MIFVSAKIFCSSNKYGVSDLQSAILWNISRKLFHRVGYLLRSTCEKRESSEIIVGAYEYKMKYFIPNYVNKKSKNTNTYLQI